MDALIYDKIETEAQRIIDAVASTGAPIKIGEQILTEPNYRLRVDLPSNWSELYDVVIGVAHMPCDTGDFLYAPFSSTGTSGEYLSGSTSVSEYNTLISAMKVGDTYKYRGFSKAAITMTPGDSDFFTIRFYSTAKNFHAGSYLVVYGFKTNTNT